MNTYVGTYLMLLYGQHDGRIGGSIVLHDVFIILSIVNTVKSYLDTYVCRLRSGLPQEEVMKWERKVGTYLLGAHMKLNVMGEVID